MGKNKLSFIRLFDTTAEHNLQNLQKDFIANASHELKTPISVIIGYCETLLSEKKRNKIEWEKGKMCKEKKWKKEKEKNGQK